MSLQPGGVLRIDTQKESNAFSEYCLACEKNGEKIQDEKHRVYVRDDCESGDQL